MKRVAFLFWDYSKKIAPVAGLFLVCAAVFAAVLFLYSAPLDGVLYALLLCGCIALISMVSGFFRYRAKCEALKELSAQITYNVNALPTPKSEENRGFLRIISGVLEEKNSIESTFNGIKRDLNDYYTLWAHQIKTPISAMSLILQSPGELDENARAELAEELFKVEQYVGMALSYLKLESSSSDYVLKKYPLDGIVKQAVRKYAKIFIRKKISLRLDELNLEVLTDEKWLGYAIEQVLSNALKYTPEGGEISICLEGQTLVVADNGIGIAAEDLPRVFDKGFTGYNGRIDKKSTGIGLYLCKRMLEKLSHSIGIESEAGRGTKVKINLARPEIGIE